MPSRMCRRERRSRPASAHAIGEHLIARRGLFDGFHDGTGSRRTTSSSLSFCIRLRERAERTTEVFVLQHRFDGGIKQGRDPRHRANRRGCCEAFASAGKGREEARPPPHAGSCGAGRRHSSRSVIASRSLTQALRTAGLSCGMASAARLCTQGSVSVKQARNCAAAASARGPRAPSASMAP
jgi:hypothetical protein